MSNQNTQIQIISQDDSEYDSQDDSEYDSEYDSDYDFDYDSDYTNITSRRSTETIRHRIITYLNKPYVVVIPYYILDPDGYIANVQSDLLTIEHKHKQSY